MMNATVEEIKMVGISKNEMMPAITIKNIESAGYRGKNAFYGDGSQHVTVRSNHKVKDKD